TCSRSAARGLRLGRESPSAPPGFASRNCCSSHSNRPTNDLASFNIDTGAETARSLPFWRPTRSGSSRTTQACGSPKAITHRHSQTRRTERKVPRRCLTSGWQDRACRMTSRVEVTKRLSLAVLLFPMCLSGCLDRTRVNTRCEWNHEPVRSLDLRDWPQQRHLYEDVALAE